MKGFHSVKFFPILYAQAHGTIELPPGWKPFGAFDSGMGYYIAARKWERIEEKEEAAPGEHTQPCDCGYCRFVKESGHSRYEKESSADAR